ncbi:MAG: lysylphosphatidylglycerol synthase transmembrane domain-containing protein [Nitrososphaeraceae archaeon]
MLAIPASIVPLILMVFFTHITVDDLLSVGVIPFVLSSAAVIGKVLLQAYRFKYFIRKFIGHDVSSFSTTISARLGSEFVSQTTPSYIGGEIVRIAWLTRKGVPAGRAAWTTTIEIISDVFVGTILGIISGVFAVLNGGYLIGTIVILLSIPTLTFWFLLMFFSAKRNLKLPNLLERIIQKILRGERGRNLVTSTNNAIADLCQMSRENFTFSSSAVIKTFAIGIAITVVAFVLQGISFMVLVNAVGNGIPPISLFDSVMATSASTVLATLPITLGGSGLAELGIWAYVANLNSIPSLQDIVTDSHLSVIVVWRIASYHVPLVIMWIALMKLTVNKDVISVRKKNLNNGRSDSNTAKRHPHGEDHKFKLGNPNGSKGQPVRDD